MQKLGFAVLSHKKPDAHFLRLLDRLSEHEHSFIAVHHDYSQSDFPAEIISKYKLIMIKPYRETAWGHISKIPATLDLFSNLFNLREEIDWFITISPNCYPIKKLSELDKFLAASSYDVYMDINEITPDKYNASNIYYYFHRALFTKKIFSLPLISSKGKFFWRPFRFKIKADKTPFKNGLKPFTGSDWHMINRRAMDAMLSDQTIIAEVSNYLAKVNEAFDVNASPVEVVFHSFFGNNQDKFKINLNYHRYIYWPTPYVWHPAILDESQFEEIKRSDAFLARKFDPVISQNLIEKIDAQLLELNLTYK